MTKLYNLDYLISLTKNDKNVIREFLDIYISESNLTIIEFKEGLETLDSTRINRAAHKIKTTLRYLNIVHLNDDVFILEKMKFDNSNTYEMEIIIDKICNQLKEIVNDIIKNEL